MNRLKCCKSLICTALWALAAVTISLTLSACDDDDDNVVVNPIVYNSQPVSFSKVYVKEQKTGYNIYFKDEDEQEVCWLDIPKEFVGRTCSLTADLTHYSESLYEKFTTGIGIGNSEFWNDDNNFTRGTIYVNVSNDLLVIKVMATGTGYRYETDDSRYPQEGVIVINYVGTYLTVNNG